MWDSLLEEKEDLSEYFHEMEEKEQQRSEKNPIFYSTVLQNFTIRLKDCK